MKRAAKKRATPRQAGIAVLQDLADTRALLRDARCQLLEAKGANERSYQSYLKHLAEMRSAVSRETARADAAQAFIAAFRQMQKVFATGPRDE